MWEIAYHFYLFICLSFSNDIQVYPKNFSRDRSWHHCLETSPHGAAQGQPLPPSLQPDSNVAVPMLSDVTLVESRSHFDLNRTALDVYFDSI